MDHSLIMHHYKFLFQLCKFSMSFFMLLQFVTDFFPTLNRFAFKIKMHKSQQRCEVSHTRLLNSPNKGTCLRKHPLKLTSNFCAADIDCKTFTQQSQLYQINATCRCLKCHQKGRPDLSLHWVTGGQSVLEYPKATSACICTSPFCRDSSQQLKKQFETSAIIIQVAACLFIREHKTLPRHMQSKLEKWYVWEQLCNLATNHSLLAN